MSARTPLKTNRAMLACNAMRALGIPPSVSRVLKLFPEVLPSEAAKAVGAERKEKS